MAQTPITELDFFQLKEQIKAYLRGQSSFRDFDFEGSNLSVLIDVLAYNTYQNNFYTNMAISEMFLDSAQLESSVMSHAKELNYLPKSMTSSRAEVNLKISAPNLTNTSSISIPAGQKFTTTHAGKSYTFYTDATQIAVLRDGSTSVYEVDCVPIYEGEIVSESFFLNTNISILPFSNQNVDISSVKVFVNNGTEEFYYRSSIFGVQPDDNVFYIEPTLNGGYGITFGKNTFGREPTFNEDIRVTYRVCSGSAPNGAFKFTTSFSYPTSVTTYSVAQGGGDKESLTSIKYFAPRSIQNQERAVTSQDYENLLRKEFGSSVIKSVSVIGGDELDPPRYGKVAVSINPYSGTTVSDSFKSSVISFLSDKTPLPIQPVFIDPEFLYASMIVNVYYSRKKTSKSSDELKTLIRSSIKDYSDKFLGNFGSTLILSKLSSIIDAIDEGIIGTTIEANPIIDYSPPINRKQNPSFKFGTPLIIPYPFDENENISNYIPSIKSSVYNHGGADVFFQDDGRGNLLLLGSNTQTLQILNPVVGSVDYLTGTVKLVNFVTDGYSGQSIKIYANTIDKNITSPKNRIFSIRDVDVTVNTIES